MPQGYGYQQPGFEQGYGAPMAPPHGAQVSRPMTIDDVTAKTGITLAVIIVSAIVSFMMWAGGVQPVAAILTFGGAIAAFITVLVHSFGKKFGSPTVTLLYAVFEGLFLGGFSFAVTGAFTVGGADAGAMIGQAILGTIGVFVGMLVVYRTGAIRVTARFNRILTGMIFGVFFMALGNFLLYLFTGMSPLRGGGTMGIIFGVVCIVLAALAFLQDFDLADKLVRTNAPQEAAWGVALGLAVTLVWLYTEILRLLSYVSDR
nr:Bax inhibitor-1/YccA family protein [Corynebacterium stercoris]